MQNNFQHKATAQKSGVNAYKQPDLQTTIMPP